MWDTVNMQTQKVSKVPPFDGICDGCIGKMTMTYKQCDTKPKLLAKILATNFGFVPDWLRAPCTEFIELTGVWFMRIAK